MSPEKIFEPPGRAQREPGCAGGRGCETGQAGKPRWAVSRRP